MSKGIIVLIVLAIVVGIFLHAIRGRAHTLVTKDQTVKAACRRWISCCKGGVPISFLSLVETVKGIAKQEQTGFRRYCEELALHCFSRERHREDCR